MGACLQHFQTELLYVSFGMRQFFQFQHTFYNRAYSSGVLLVVFDLIFIIKKRAIEPFKQKSKCMSHVVRVVRQRCC